MPKKNYFAFKQLADDPERCQLFIYDDITGIGHFDWRTWEYEESETSAEYFREKLEENKNCKYLDIYINSCGGDVFEAYAIASQIQRFQAFKTAYIDGVAASAASLVCAVCDKVVMTTFAMQMIHNMWMIAQGNANELRKCADDIDNIMKGNRQLYLQRFNGTEEELMTMLDNETWLTAQECLDYGLCDEIDKGTSDQENTDTIAQKISGMNQELSRQIKMRQMLKQQYDSFDFKQSKIKKEAKEAVKVVVEVGKDDEDDEGKEPDNHQTCGGGDDDKKKEVLQNTFLQKFLKIKEEN